MYLLWSSTNKKVKAFTNLDVLSMKGNVVIGFLMK